MIQYDCLVSVRPDLNLTVKADDLIWTKLNELVKDRVIDIPEVHATSAAESVLQ